MFGKYCTFQRATYFMVHFLLIAAVLHSTTEMNGIFLFFLFLFKSFSAVIKVVLVWRVNVCQASVCDFTQMQQLPASLGQTKVSSL